MVISPVRVVVALSDLGVKLHETKVLNYVETRLA
jgi:hypothetical protein